MRLLLLALVVISAAEAAKIAIFVMPLSNSHVIFTNRVAEELAQDHEVVIIRPNVNPKASTLVSKHPRVREIRPTGVSPETFEEYKKAERLLVWEDVGLQHFFAISAGFRKMLGETCADFIKDDALMAHMREEKFDFALVHHFDTCPVSVAEAAGIPSFGYILSTPLIPSFASLVGVPILPSLYPSHLLDADNQMTFGQRIKNYVLDLFFSTFGRFFQSRPVNAMFREKFGQDFKSNGDLTRQAKMLLVNAHPDIEFPVPVTSKVIHFGGLGMSNATKPLEKPYSSFVNKAERVVFVSFGTVAEPDVMPAEWKQAFVDLFEKNPSIHFIWRMDESVAVPKNVLRSMWHPQKDLLGHPKVAAFITHAGYNSIGESIASGTPLITVPLFGDQFRNARLAAYRGFGEIIPKTELTFDNLNTALHKILDNPSYEQKAAGLRKIVFSNPVKAGDTLRHAVNFALEYPDHDRSLPDLPFYQLYSLDVIAVLFIFPLFIPLLAKWCYWSCCKMAYKEKEKMN